MKKFLLTLLTLAALSSTAMALDTQPPADEAGQGMGRRMHQGEEGDRRGRPHFRMMEEMDADKDGSVTKKEATAFHEKRFDEMDANKDGKISKEELKTHRPQCMNNKSVEDKK